MCPVEADWVTPLVERLRNVDVERLSGGAINAATFAVAQGNESPCDALVRGPLGHAYSALMQMATGTDECIGL